MIIFRRLNLAALILCFVVVVVGAYVRLSHAGLGCPDWPGCYGQFTVLDAAPDAGKAWKEMFHRYIASTLGLLIVGLALLSVIKRREGLPRVLPWALVALVIFQGVLGMWTVIWQLKPLAVTAHLLGGMATLALLFWQWLLLKRPHPDPLPKGEGTKILPLPPGEVARSAGEGVSKLRLLSSTTLVLLVVQIFLGGWTSSNYAALACPDLPTCHGVWLPDTDVKEAFTLWRGLGTNYEFGVLDSRARVTIHLAHRAGALLVTLALLILSFALWRAGRRPLGIAVLGALALQVTIGLSVVLLQLPLWLAAAHNAGAALLLLTLIAVNHSLHERIATNA